MERYVLAIGGNIAKHPDGGWVKYEDAARLAEENRRLREQAEILTRMLEASQVVSDPRPFDEGGGE